MDAEPRFLRKKVRAGRIDAHPTENAVVVNYEVTAEILTDLGEPMVADAKRSTQTIRVNNLKPGTDVEALAVKLMERCKLITPAKLPELVDVLAFLLKRSRSKEFKALVKEQRAARKEQGSLLDHSKTHEVARVSEIDRYMDLLYEGTPDKVRGTSLILQVAQNPDNLEELVESEAVMGALARVLREEGGRSRELATNIIHVFYILSSYTDFHHVLKQHKIGNLCLACIAREVERYDEWQTALAKKLDRLGRGSAEAEALLDKYNEQCFRQESLLYVAAHLLLNLAEDTRVQVKMKNKGILQHMLELLDRDNVEFLVLVVAFLKKLSIFKENKDEMAEADVVHKLVRLVRSPHDALVGATLGLLLNLSFDAGLRRRMVELDLAPVVAELGSNPDLPQHALLGTLYHLSMEEGARASMFSRDLFDQVLHPEAPMEVVALWVNLALDPSCAAHVCEGDGLEQLVRAALELDDPLVMKIVRNLSRHPGEHKEQFLEHIDELCSYLVDATNEDMVVEILGVIGNMDVEDFDHAQLLTEYNLLPFVNERLLPSAADDDVVLQLVVLLGTCLADEDTAELIARSGTVGDLVKLLGTPRREDPEIVLQIVYVFYKLLFHRPTRGLVLKQAAVIRELIEFLGHPNAEVKKMSGAALDIVVEVDEGWGDEIRARRFEIHNAAWIEAMSGGGGGLGAGGEFGVAYDPRYEGDAPLYDQQGWDAYGGELGDHYGFLEEGEANLDFDASQYGGF